MESNPIKADARHARRRRVLPVDARCACGETNVHCLIPTGDDVICYACRSMTAGRSRTEQHHVAGRHNLDTTVPVLNNDHRVLSDRQHDWPSRTLRNPDRSPLLQAAGAIRGWLDILALILERVVGWIPLFLETLDAWLCQRLGDAWWSDFLSAAPNALPAHVKGVSA